MLYKLYFTDLQGERCLSAHHEVAEAVGLTVAQICAARKAAPNINYTAEPVAPLYELHIDVLAGGGETMRSAWHTAAGPVPFIAAVALWQYAMEYSSQTLTGHRFHIVEVSS